MVAFDRTLFELGAPIHTPLAPLPPQPQPEGPICPTRVHAWLIAVQQPPWPCSAYKNPTRSPSLFLLSPAATGGSSNARQHQEEGGRSSRVGGEGKRREESKAGPVETSVATGARSTASISYTGVAGHPARRQLVMAPARHQTTILAASPPSISTTRLPHSCAPSP
jgi:hypothetical protein